jgi:hypothetical protein
MSQTPPTLSNTIPRVGGGDMWAPYEHLGCGFSRTYSLYSTSGAFVKPWPPSVICFRHVMSNCGHACHFEGLARSIFNLGCFSLKSTRSQNEPAPTNALVGRSVHRTSCALCFHPSPEPATLTNIVHVYRKKGCSCLTLVCFGHFFSQLRLSSYHPDLATLPTYILALPPTYQPIFMFVLLN